MPKRSKAPSFPGLLKSDQADVAQLVEQPIRNRQVSGSSPLVGSIIFNHIGFAGTAPGVQRVSNEVVRGPVSLHNLSSRDAVFKLCHGATHVIRGTLDVERHRRAHIGVAQDSLDYDVTHAEPIQVAA